MRPCNRQTDNASHLFVQVIHSLFCLTILSAGRKQLEIIGAESVAHCLRTHSSYLSRPMSFSSALSLLISASFSASSLLCRTSCRLSSSSRSFTCTMYMCESHSHAGVYTCSCVYLRVGQLPLQGLPVFLKLPPLPLPPLHQCPQLAQPPLTLTQRPLCTAALMAYAWMRVQLEQGLHVHVQYSYPVHVTNHCPGYAKTSVNQRTQEVKASLQNAYSTHVHCNVHVAPLHTQCTCKRTHMYVHHNHRSELKADLRMVSVFSLMVLSSVLRSSSSARLVSSTSSLSLASRPFSRSRSAILAPTGPSWLLTVW